MKGNFFYYLKKFHKIFFYIPAFFLLIIIRLVKPFILIRLESTQSHRIGHFTATPELYLCEIKAGINKPKKKYIDFFFNTYLISNHYFNDLLRRSITILPTFISVPIYRLNKLIPGGKIHEIGKNIGDTKNHRDVNHLFDQYKNFIFLRNEDLIEGMELLTNIGIPNDAKIVCLNVRDNAYLDYYQPEQNWSYHNYRDTDINNYAEAALYLAERGYYVFRMGVKVNKQFKVKHPKIIDYAFSSFKSEYMDVFLASRCEFCISVGSGFDSLPYVFRKPIVFVNHVPICHFFTFSDKFINLTKHHYHEKEKRFLKLSEIFNYQLADVGRSEEFERNNIKLIENTSLEIKNVVKEMIDKLEKNNINLLKNNNKDLQEKFHKIYKAGLKKYSLESLHGEIKSTYSSSFLIENEWWLN